MTAVVGIATLLAIVAFVLCMAARERLHFRKTLRQIRRLPVREPKRRVKS